jgi:hypothetical protein
MEKLFRSAGVARHLDVSGGKLKVKFVAGNLQKRIDQLIYHGFKDIDIIELKKPMTKKEAVEFLLKINFDNGNAEVRECLELANGRKLTAWGKDDEPTLEELQSMVESQLINPIVTPTRESALAKIAEIRNRKKDTPTKKQIEQQLADLDDQPY